MKSRIRKFTLISAALLALRLTGCFGEHAVEAEGLFNSDGPGFSFVSYSSFGGGAGLTMTGEIHPLASGAAGFQITPWLAIGGFTTAAPLSEFTDWSNGIQISDRDNSYSLMSGTEILWTPYANKIIHPVTRLGIGGISVGYLENLDGDEEMEGAVDKRYFFASAGIGAELNVTPHIRAYGMITGQFSANDKWLGLNNGELSGAGAVLGVRVLWATTIR